MISLGALTCFGVVYAPAEILQSANRIMGKQAIWIVNILFGIRLLDNTDFSGFVKAAIRLWIKVNNTTKNGGINLWES